MNKLLNEFNYIYTKYNGDVFKFLLRITNYDYLLAEELTQNGVVTKGFLDLIR